MEFTDIAQWSATILGVIYVLGAAFKKIWCWPFGIVGSFIFAWISFTANYYQDAILQLYYVGMGVYGWVNWKNSSQISQQINIQTRSKSFHIIFVGIGIALSIASGFYFKGLGNDLPFVDAFTTVFSVMVTWMVAKRILENWVYWILIDMVGIYMYYVKGLNVISGLFIFYTLFAIAGLYLWTEEYNRQNTAS